MDDLAEKFATNERVFVHLDDFADTSEPSGQQWSRRVGNSLRGLTEAFVTGQTRPNLVVVPVGADGTVALYNSSGAAVLADVAGFES